mgnify:FL=1
MIIETAELEEVDGKTKLIIRDLFQTAEDRDGMFSSGMERGSTESMDRFEKLLKEAVEKRGSSLFPVG